MASYPDHIIDNLWKVEAILNFPNFSMKDATQFIHMGSYTCVKFPDGPSFIFQKSGHVMTYDECGFSNLHGPYSSDGRFRIDGVTMTVFEFVDDIRCKCSDSEKIEPLLKYG